MLARCAKLAAFSETPGGICRTFLSPPMRDCHREIAAWLTAAGAAVTVDAAGNLRGLYPASQRGAARLILGSHLDTVPNAGAYDGVLGVVIAIALLESLHGQSLPFAVEVVGFSEEEGVRFGTPFIGSRALVGRVDDQLLMKASATKVYFVVLVSFLIATQEAVPVSVLVSTPIAERREEAGTAMPVKV